MGKLSPCICKLFALTECLHLWSVQFNEQLNLIPQQPESPSNALSATRECRSPQADFASKHVKISSLQNLWKLCPHPQQGQTCSDEFNPGRKCSDCPFANLMNDSQWSSLMKKLKCIPANSFWKGWAFSLSRGTSDAWDSSFRITFDALMLCVRFLSNESKRCPLPMKWIQATAMSDIARMLIKVLASFSNDLLTARVTGVDENLLRLFRVTRWRRDHFHKRPESKDSS